MAMSFADQLAPYSAAQIMTATGCPRGTAYDWKDGRREPFDRTKVIAGLTKACEKRPISREVVEQAADEVERAVRDELAEEVSSAEIGQLVMEKLREIDEVAYVRFASVYKEFRDADSFLKEVEGLVRKSRPPGLPTGSQKAE